MQLNILRKNGEGRGEELATGVVRVVAVAGFGGVAVAICVLQRGLTLGDSEERGQQGQGQRKGHGARQKDPHGILLSIDHRLPHQWSLSRRSSLLSWHNAKD